MKTQAGSASVDDSCLSLPEGWVPLTPLQRLTELQRVLRLNPGRMLEMQELREEQADTDDGGLLIIPKISALTRNVNDTKRRGYDDLLLASMRMKDALTEVYPAFRDYSAGLAPERTLHERTQALLDAQEPTDSDYLLLRFSTGTRYTGYSATEADRDMQQRTNPLCGIPAHEVAGLAFMLTDLMAFGPESVAMAFAGTRRGRDMLQMTLLMYREGAPLMDSHQGDPGHCSVCLPHFLVPHPASKR